MSADFLTQIATGDVLLSHVYQLKALNRSPTALAVAVSATKTTAKAVELQYFLHTTLKLMSMRQHFSAHSWLSLATRLLAMPRLTLLPKQAMSAMDALTETLLILGKAYERN